MFIRLFVRGILNRLSYFFFFSEISFFVFLFLDLFFVDGLFGFIFLGIKFLNSGVLKFKSTFEKFVVVLFNFLLCEFVFLLFFDSSIFFFLRYR